MQVPVADGKILKSAGETVKTVNQINHPAASSREVS